MCVEEGLRTGIRGFDGILRQYGLIIIPSLLEILNNSAIRWSEGISKAQPDAGRCKAKMIHFVPGDLENSALNYPCAFRMQDSNLSRTLRSG